MSELLLLLNAAVDGMVLIMYGWFLRVYSALVLECTVLTLNYANTLGKELDRSM